MKHSLDRLTLPEAPESPDPLRRRRHGIDPLPLNDEASLYSGRLPGLHRDPLDRMLVWQAILEGIALLAPDKSIARYPVRTIW